jgi:protoporphyrinogen oxidase
MKPLCDGRIVIIGGGPAGLGAAATLHRFGYDDWVLYEKEPGMGGLSASFADEQGFTWDLGGHVTFSHYDRFDRLLDGLIAPEGWFEHERESWVRIFNTWVPYPFQYNIRLLPAAQREACLAGLARAAENRSDEPYANFEDFIHRIFGTGIAEIFMLPYNYKVWAYEPKKLAVDWIGERVAVPDLERIRRNIAEERDDVSWGPNNRFRFPRHGGTGAIWDALARQLPAERLKGGCPVRAVAPRKKELTLANGGTDRYDHLINTAPLDLLVGTTGEREWMDLAAGLTHSAIHVVGVGLKGSAGPEMREKCWMYFPEDNNPFYRVTHFSHYSTFNVADIDRQWSLMCEVSESPDKPVDRDGVAEETVNGLLATGLIDSANEVSHTWVRRVEHAYPTPTPGRQDVLEPLLQSLLERDILSRGRFGAWKYEVGNMDHCYMQGVEAVCHLLFGTPELTVWHPGFVNNPGRPLVTR